MRILVTGGAGYIGSRIFNRVASSKKIFRAGSKYMLACLLCKRNLRASWSNMPSIVLDKNGMVVLDNAERVYYHETLKIFNGLFMKAHWWIGTLPVVVDGVNNANL